MIELKVKCNGCGGFAVIKNLSLPYKLSDVLKNMNYHKFSGHTYCDYCFKNEIKKAG